MSAGRSRPREKSAAGASFTVISSDRSPLAKGLKRLAQFAALIWVTPRLVAYRIARLLFGTERAFLASSESVARIPGTRGVYCRQAFYRRTLARCGQDVYFGWMSTFSRPQASIGRGAYIGRQCTIGLAAIGDEVMLADGVQVLSGRRQHTLADKVGPSHRGLPQTFREIEIGNGAWLGAGAVVMANVGACSAVGAGAVVVDPVPARVVAAGVPAKVVRTLGSEGEFSDRSERSR